MACPVCGYDNKDKRSLPQLRRFWKMLGAYLHHWPERHSFQPESKEQLKAWAMIHTGNYDVIDYQPGKVFSFNVPSRYAFCKDTKEGLRFWLPKSISFHAMGHQKACEALSDVEEFLEGETGLKADEVMIETENAA